MAGTITYFGQAGKNLTSLFDFPEQQLCQDITPYLNLIDGASPHQTTGEGSVWYLYSDVPLHNLAGHRSDATIIIMLRNPVDAAYSLHAQKLFKLDGNVQSFSDAWELQAVRRRPPDSSCMSGPSQLQYHRVYCYSWQLRTAFGLFPPEQTKIIISEEFFANTSAHLDAICKFLNVPGCNDGSLGIVNPNREWRYPSLTRAVQQQVAKYPRTAAVGKTVVNAVWLQPLRWFEQWNLRN